MNDLFLERSTIVVRFRAYPASATALLTIMALGVLSACAPQGPGANAEASEVLGSSDLRITSVSTRPYLVTGGDVLLRIEAGEDLDLSQVRVSANGMDVTEHQHSGRRRADPAFGEGRTGETCRPGGQLLGHPGWGTDERVTSPCLRRSRCL